MGKALKPDLSEFLPPPKPCLLGERLDELEPQDRVNVEAALAHPEVEISRILSWFAARNLRVGEHTVRRHRKGKCPCPKPQT